MRDFKYLAESANQILSKGTKYSKDKEIISEIFTSSKSMKDKVILRLTVIDSFYSTQMNKRFFGIEEISDSINEISDDDEKLINITFEYINGENKNKISSLIGSKYGYKKIGQPHGKASSLITKYLYFLTKYKFPIYDSLVKKSYENIKKKYQELNIPKLPRECNYSYFKAFKELSHTTKINDFDLLDNLLWLYGKIREGTFSLILKKQEYLNLVGEISFSEKVKSREADKTIREYIKNPRNKNKLNSLLGKRMIDFIEFCLT